MNKNLVFYFFVSAIVVVSCEEVKENAVKTELNRVKTTLKDFIPCAVNMNVACLIDNADNFLLDKRNELLAEADKEAIASGRADKDGKPSELAETLSKMIEELSDLFKDGVSSLFKTAKEGEKESEVEETTEEGAEGDEDNKPKSRALEEGRKKEKKKKLKKLIHTIKFLVLGGAMKVVIGTLLKIFHAHLQKKFLLIALASLALNAARFYLDLKKSKHPQKVIYYEHAQHQHHYEHDEHDDYGHSHEYPESYGGQDEHQSHSGPGSSYWGRAYDEQEAVKKSGQNLAYAAQKPYQSQQNQGTLSSWLG